MHNIRTPEEIRLRISELTSEAEKLKEELHISCAINGETSYDKYKGKWVFHDAYESGCDYIYVLGITDNVDDVYFYGYGVHYDYQLKKLEIISSEYQVISIFIIQIMLPLLTRKMLRKKY